MSYKCFKADQILDLNDLTKTYNLLRVQRVIYSLCPCSLWPLCWVYILSLAAVCWKWTCFHTGYSTHNWKKWVLIITGSTIAKLVGLAWKAQWFCTCFLWPKYIVLIGSCICSFLYSLIPSFLFPTFLTICCEIAKPVPIAAQTPCQNSPEIMFFPSSFPLPPQCFYHLAQLFLKQGCDLKWEIHLY